MNRLLELWSIITPALLAPNQIKKTSSNFPLTLLHILASHVLHVTYFKKYNLLQAPRAKSSTTTKELLSTTFESRWIIMRILLSPLGAPSNKRQHWSSSKNFSLFFTKYSTMQMFIYTNTYCWYKMLNIYYHHLLSYYLANKRSLHICSQGLEIPTLIKEKKRKITHHCHYDKNWSKIPPC